MKKSLAGCCAFITGGAGGIGSACAASLLKDGASVTLMGRSLESLEKVREQLLPHVNSSAGLYVVAGDALKKSDVRRAIAFAEASMGGINMCVPTVGGGGIRPLLLHDEQSFQQELELNIMPAFLTLRYVAPVIAKSGGGSIVCISSDAAKLVFPWMSAYCTSKSGLEGLVKTAAEELSHLNIRVNAVRPGLTRTAATQSLFEDPEIHKAFAEQKPLKRLGEPEDIAAGVRYLLGPESSWVTGQSLAIEGGNELRKAPDVEAMVRQIFGSDTFDQMMAGKEMEP